jgi:hypothetical protein
MAALLLSPMFNSTTRVKGLGVIEVWQQARLPGGNTEIPGCAGAGKPQVLRLHLPR